MTDRLADKGRSRLEEVAIAERSDDMEESVSDQGIGPYLLLIGYLAVCAVLLATGLLMLIAPRRVPRLPWITDALVPEEKLQYPSYRLEMRIAGALMAVMVAYMMCRPFM